jgi:hypothetical protein
MKKKKPGSIVRQTRPNPPLPKALTGIPGLDELTDGGLPPIGEGLR